MDCFCRSMRKRYDILMEKDKPFGGQWNYDQKNRQAYGGRVPIPKPLFFENDVTSICETLHKSLDRFASKIYKVLNGL